VSANPLGLGKTKSEAVNELSDSGIRGQWGHAAILRPPLACVNEAMAPVELDRGLHPAVRR